MARALVVLAAVILVLPAMALADGCYIPQVAYPAMPEIPLQRALIIHRDGMETLIVESAFKSDSPDVGWILPLPAEPTKFEVADSGLLTSLAVCLRPKVIHDLHNWYWPAICILIFIVPLALRAILSDLGVTLAGVLVWGLFSMLVLALFMPAGTSGGNDTASPAVAEILSAQKVGDYDIAVLRARRASELSRWLAENGLRSLDPRAQEIADDYLSRGWCFAVARLSRSAGGEAIPYPLSVTFPSERPVYPMRMTALAGTATRMELYVIADRMAEAVGFRSIAADRYHPVSMDSEAAQWSLWYRTHGWYLHLFIIRDGEKWQRMLPPNAVVYCGARPSLAIGNPLVGAMMWDGCVVTHLEGDLTPDQMISDIELRLRDLRPHREVVFSPQGRGEVMLSVALWGGVPLVVSCAVVFYKRRRPSQKQLRALLILGLVLVVLALGVGLVLRTVPVGPSLGPTDPFRQAEAISEAASHMAAVGALHSDMSSAELSQLPQKMVEMKLLVPDGPAGKIYNPLTGAALRLERSPGNIWVRRTGGETVFCIYDEYGIELPVMAIPSLEESRRLKQKHDEQVTNSGPGT